MTNVGHFMGSLNRWALSKPLPIRRDIYFTEYFGNFEFFLLGCKYEPFFPKWQKFFDLILQNLRTANLVDRTAVKQHREDWTWRSSEVGNKGAVAEYGRGKVLVVKDFRPDCPQKGARRCNFLHKWSRNRENMSLATYISFQTSENIWGNVQNK